MKRKTLWLCIALITTVLNAQQVQVQAIQPNLYFLKSEDVFNLQITNPTSTAIDVKIKGVWFLEGKKAVELVSENTTLQPGVNSFNAQNPGVSSKTYLIKAVDEVETTTGNMPAGNYRACVYLSCIRPDCNGVGTNVITSENSPCYTLNVVSPTPLLLSSQINNNVSSEKRPQFTWIPPMPLGGNPDVTYTLTLVKKNSAKQGCTDAILRNRPLLKQDNISGTILNYPADIDALDTGDYAWQVSASLEGLTVATSEVWCFKVQEKKEKKDTLMYIELRRTLDAGFISYNEDDLFCFIFNGTYKNVELKCKIFNENTNTEVFPLAEKMEESAKREEEILLHSFGENKYAIELNNYSLAPGRYIVKIKDHLGIEYFQRIVIK